MRKRICIIFAMLLLICMTVSLAASANGAGESAVTGAALWLRADQGVETDDHGVVTKWKDQSGNDRDGVPYGDNGMPKLKESSINGKPGLLFEGGTQVVDIPVPLREGWGQEFSVFFVYKPASVPSGGKHFIGADDWRMFNLHTYEINGGLYAGNTTTQNASDANARINSTENPGTYAAGEPVLLQFTHQNGVAALWKNGVKIVEKSMPSPMMWDKFRLGIPGTNVGLDGELCELLVFDEELTADQQSSVTNYLHTKYFVSEDHVVTDASLWLRADQGVETDENGVVTKWKDQSGNDRDGVPYGDNGMPKLKESSINGKPGLLFEGGTQVVDIPVPLREGWGQEFSVFFVYKPASVPSGGKHFIGADDWRMFNLHTYGIDGGLYAGNTTTQNASDANARINGTENPGTYAAGEPVLLQFTHQNGVAALWKNGVKIVEKSMPSPMMWDKFRLGIPGTNAGLDGELSELIVFDEELSLSKQADVSRYLYKKYFNDVERGTLTISQTTLSLVAGESANLTVTGTENGDELVWSSSNSAVVSVDTNGKVTGVSAGTATITALVQGQFRYAECVVTVEQQSEENGLVLWLDAAEVETDTNGILTKWPDKSGKNNHGIPYSGTSMPTLVENELNGNPVVRFETENGVKDAVNIPTLTGDMENFSVYFVYRPASVQTPYNHVVRAKGEWKQFIMHTYYQESEDGSLYIGSDLHNRFSNTNAGKDYYHAGEWNILEYRAQGSVTSLYQNGILLDTIDTGNISEPWTGFDIGAIDQMYGDMAELLVYNNALTNEERAEISQYLQQKYYGRIAPEIMTVTSSNGTMLDKTTSTTQLSVTVEPAEAGAEVIWRVTDLSGNETELASITEDGLLTVSGTGSVLVTATHKASGVSASLKITADIQRTYEVRGIKTITAAGGTTQLSVWEDGVQLPGVKWTLYGEDLQSTDLARIEQSGVITAAKNGTVIAVAEKNGQTWAANVTISGQAATGAAVDAVYVSESGSDSDPGTFEAPKKTIAAGLATGADYVYVLSGNYDLSQTLKPASGQTLAGYPMGTALVTGGYRVPADTVWTQVEGKSYYAADVTVSNPFRELYVNGELVKLAESNSFTASWYAENGANKGYIIRGLDLPADTNSNMEMHWNHRYWRCNRLVVDEVRQTDGGVILLPEFESFRWATVCDFAAAGPVASEPFTLLNDLAFLDEPGEWFYDADTDKLYYYPQPGERMEKLEVYIPQIDTLVELSGTDVDHKVQNITIDNLHFAYTTWQRAVVHGSAAVQADFVSNDIGNGSHTDAGELPAAVIHSEFASGITIRNCDIRNTGANAIILENAVSDCVVANNLIEDTAFSAITVSRPQNSFLDQDNEEVPKDILIFNNRIDNAAWKYHSGSGVCGYYTDGLTVDHNHISHTAWAGMTFGWNGWQATEKDSITHRNLTVTHNYVYSFAEVSRDSGGIYTLGQCPNAMIAYNHLEKLVRDYAGIYNDEGSGYFYVGHNVMDDVNGSVVNWWTSTIHDMYAEGNYHNVGGTNNKATRGYIVGTQQYASGNRPAEAQAIVDNAGLTDQPYQPLRSFTAGNLAAGKNVTFVQPNGAADYGTIGHMPQFAANGLETYAEAAVAGSALVVDLLAYYDLTGASLTLLAGDSLPSYTVEVSADSIEWAAWDGASETSHVRYVRFVPDASDILQVQEVIVSGTKATSFSGKADMDLTLPQSSNLTVQLQAESARMVADHLTTWINDAGGSAARIPTSHSKGLDEHAVANSGYSKKPIVMEGIITGRPMVRFDGFDDAMQVDNVDGTAASMTLMLYVRPTDAAHFKFSSDGFTLQMVNGAYSLTIGSTTLTASQPAVLNTWQLMILTVSDGTAVLTVDGETVLEGAVSGGSSHNTLYLGDNVGIRHKNYGTALGVDLAELALYRTALSAADRSELSELVMKKYSNVISVTGVSLDQTAAELILREEGRNTIQLAATVQPEDATNREVVWSSANDLVAKVNNGLVTAVSKGVTTITVTTVDGSISASCQITVVDPVGDVEAKIEAIGEVTLESEADILDAEVAYADLTDDQKALVTNHEDLTTARETYNDLKAAADKLAADKAAAKGVDAKIEDIGEVTLESKDAIEAARNAYTALEDDQEQWVTKLDVLKKAEVRLADLQAANAVDTLIDLIGDVTLEDKAAIEAAEKAYDELTEEQQAEVQNYAKLLAARAEYNRLKAAADKLAADKAAAKGVDDLIDTIGEVDLDSKDRIEAVRAAYEALTADEKAHVTKLAVLEAAEAEYARLKEQRDLLISMIIAGASNPKLPFTDVTKADWFYDEVNGAWQAGLINGMTETTFEPNGNLTVAQAIKLAAALHQRNEKGRVTLKNGDTAWYSSYVEYAVRNKIIGAEYLTCSDGKMNSAVSRAEFVHILHGALSYYRPMNVVADNAIPDVKTGSVYASEIYEFYRAGILTGSDANGTFYPASSIKRSEVAAILVRMYDKDARQAVTLN